MCISGWDTVCAVVGLTKGREVEGVWGEGGTTGGQGWLERILGWGKVGATERYFRVSL